MAPSNCLISAVAALRGRCAKVEEPPPFRVSRSCRAAAHRVEMVSDCNRTAEVRASISLRSARRP